MTLLLKRNQLFHQFTSILSISPGEDLTKLLVDNKAGASLICNIIKTTSVQVQNDKFFCGDHGFFEIHKENLSL